MIRRKKKVEGEIIPPIQPETQEYEMHEPPIQEDMYYTPPEEATPDIPTPDYTTPVQPEPEQIPAQKGIDELEE
jgi:hypothetical protein